jgi:hypothetical protein
MRAYLRYLLVGALVAAVAGCGDTVSTSDIVPQSGHLVALTTTGEMIWLDPSHPDAIIGSVTPRAANATGVSFVALAYRPLNGGLYARGSNGGLYSVDPGLGSAALVGSQGLVFQTATKFAVAFAPGDRLRLVSNLGDNVRIDPTSGSVLGDLPLATTAEIGAIAYTQPSGSAPTLFAIDNTNKFLVRIGGEGGVPSPNLGDVFNIGSLGLADSAVTAAGMAITPAGQAYAVLRGSSDGVTKLYTISLTTGAATLVGPFGTGAQIRGLALAP